MYRDVVGIDKAFKILCPEVEVRADDYDQMAILGREPSNKNFPIELGLWRYFNYPEEKYIFRGIYQRTLDEVDRVIRLISINKEIPEIWVTGTHTSKSIVLPVLELRYGGLTITMRYNGFDWTVSIKSMRPIKIPDGIFDSSPEARIFYQGFREDQIYGTYTENNRQFSIAVDSYEHLVLLFYMIRVSLQPVTKTMTQDDVLEVMEEDTFGGFNT